MSKSNEKKPSAPEVEEMDSMNYVARWLKQVKPETQPKPPVAERRSKRLLNKEMEETESLLVSESGEAKKRKDVVPQSILKDRSAQQGRSNERSSLLKSPRFRILCSRNEAQGSYCDYDSDDDN